MVGRIRVKRKAVLKKWKRNPQGKRTENEVRLERGIVDSLGHIIQDHIGHEKS